MEQQHFGQLLKAMRKEKRMTQQAVADKLGVTNRQISLWEQKASVTSDTIQKYLWAIGYTITFTPIPEPEK